MQEDLSIMDDLTLTAEEKRDLEIGDELGLSGFYCAQCGKCLAQCPARAAAGVTSSVLLVSM